MNRSLLLLATLLTTSFACEKEDDDDNDSGADTGSATSPSTSNTTSTTSTEETCVSDHGCIGTVCTCETPGLENMPCTDETACEEECEVCM